MNKCLSILMLSGGLLGCGPGAIPDDSADAQPDPPADLGSGVDTHEEDPWSCGELGLKCIGPLGIGACIDGQCQPRLGGPCLGPIYAPTCDNYCAQLDKACAPLGCEGATAYGWVGTQAFADNACLDGNDDIAVALEIPCDEPLEGLVNTVLCCCEY